jgi:hypothetical protein
MQQITEYRVLTPGFFFFTEHARHYTDDSGELEYEEDDRTDPPSHNFSTS